MIIVRSTRVSFRSETMSVRMGKEPINLTSSVFRWQHLTLYMIFGKGRVNERCFGELIYSPSNDVCARFCYREAFSHEV